MRHKNVNGIRNRNHLLCCLSVVPVVVAVAVVVAAMQTNDSSKDVADKAKRENVSAQFKSCPRERGKREREREKGRQREEGKG